MYPSKIVGASHLPKVKDALEKVDAAIHEAELAQRAGIGKPEHMDELKAAKDKLLKFKSVYFPNH